MVVNYQRHRRNYGGSGRGSFQHRNHRDGDSVDYKSLRDAFLAGNFSQVRSNLKNATRALGSLYNEVKGKAKEFPKWSNKDIITNAAIVAAYAVAKDLRTTQIRKIIEMAKDLHTSIRMHNPGEGDIRSRISSEALRMNMLMAYYAGKNRSVLPLQEVLEPILGWLSEEENATPENFEKVYTFFEAIVAYHRYFGGKD